MKKKYKRIIGFIMTLIMVLSTMSVNIGSFKANAESSDKILTGTPVLDGKVDEIYERSLTLTTGTGDNAYGTAWSNDHGNIYFLHDENYLYICADIKDNSVWTAGDEYVSGSNPYQNDNCEFRLSLDGGTTTIKVGIDAYGMRAYGLDADMQKIDYDKILYKTTWVDSGTDTGYVIEAAIPCTEGILDMHTAGKLGFKLQLNDLDFDGAYKYFATDYAGEGAKGLVYYELSDEIVTSGGSDEILMGTPVFDGKVDGIYRQSLTLTTGTGNNAYGTAWSEDHGNIYFLYDNDYLYICADIKDDSVWTAGDDYVSGTNPYQNDNCEFRLSLDGGTTTIKVGIDAYGMRAYGLDADMQKTDYSKILYKTTRVESGTDTGYVIEAAIPCTEGILDMHTADKLGFKLQLNDLDFDGSYKYFATDYAGEGAKGLVYYNLSDTQVTGGVSGGVSGGDASGDDTSGETSGDLPVTDYKVLSFAEDGNAKLVASDVTTCGSSVYNADLDLRTVVCETTIKAVYKTYYMMRAGFNTKDYYSEDYKYMRVLYAAELPEGASDVTLQIDNPNTGNNVNWTVEDTEGKLVFSPTLDVSVDSTGLGKQTVLGRLVAGGDVRFQAPNLKAEGYSYQIKGYYFFKSEEEADRFVLPAIEYKVLSFAGEGNYKHSVTSDTGWGSFGQDEETGTVVLTYGESQFNGSKTSTRYMFRPKFASKTDYDSAYKYARMEYAADHPEGVGTVDAMLWNPAKGGTSTFAGLADTNGEFVLSDVVELDEKLIDRYAAGGDVATAFMTTEEDGRYLVKAIYFFKTKADANSFDLSQSRKEIQVNGNDISKYQIVLPENALGTEETVAKNLMYEIYAISGVKLPIVTDSEEATDYEILIGDTNREESDLYYTEGGRFHPTHAQFAPSQWRADRVGDKLVLVAGMRAGMNKAADAICKKIKSSTSDVVNLTAETLGQGIMVYITTEWADVVNVTDPEQFEDDFDTDEGYWSVDSNKQGWKYASEGDEKVFKSDDSALTLSYLHTYEKNAIYETKMKYTGAVSDNATMGVIMRYTHDDAYVKLGYDFERGEWYIDTREGKDFLKFRVASKQETLTAGQWYDVKAVVDAETAELYVNGEKIISTDALTQMTPGKLGMFAEGVAVTADDVKITMLSGMGKIIKNVVHTRLPGDFYIEGGSVLEMKDGTLIYQHHHGTCYTSSDDGKTWTKSDAPLLETENYFNMLRLQNGEILKMDTVVIEGVWKLTAQISSDEGQTWQLMQELFPVYEDTDEWGRIVNGNINDRLSQMSDGRIIYTSTSVANGRLMNDKNKTWGKFYYSDDNGRTWDVLPTETNEIEGLVDQQYFGEAKVIDTAEGNLRVYNSQNSFGCIAYSESTDNGLTWGPVQKMEELLCTASTFSVVKDPYADNDTTYYMVYVRNTTGRLIDGFTSNPRPCLALLKSTDGINWVSLGDIWLWENRYTWLTHVVDPFVQVTEDYLIVGSGFAEGEEATSHNAQRQNIYSIAKSTLEDGTWKTDDTAHWQEVVAGEEDEANKVEHSSTGDNVANCTNKAVCDICGVEYGTVAHDYDPEVWESNAEGHWHDCSDCTTKVMEAEHMPGAAATETTPQTCTVCGYVITPATGETTTEAEETTTEAEETGERKYVIEVLKDSDISEELKEKGIDTIAKVEDILHRAIIADGRFTKEHTIIRDVQLMISEDGGNTWVEADRKHFPADGKITVILPYPEGTSGQTHDFRVVHMFTSDVNGKVPGTVEVPTVTETESGLQVILTGLSPVSVSWIRTTETSETPEENPESSEAGEETGGETESVESSTGSAEDGGDMPDDPATGDASNIALWFMVTIVAVLASILDCIFKKKCHSGTR